MTWKFHIMLFYALLDLLTIQSSIHDGNTAYKHSNEVVIFTLFSLGVCPNVPLSHNNNVQTAIRSPNTLSVA